MSRKRGFLVGLGILLAIALLALAFSGYFRPKILDPKDVKLMVVSNRGPHTFNNKEDKSTILKVVRALNRARRGRSRKLGSSMYLLFHLRSGKCLAFGVSLPRQGKAVYIADAGNGTYYSREMFGVLDRIVKTKENLYKNTSLPEYEVKLFRIHYPGNRTRTVNKKSAVFSPLTKKVKKLTESVNTIHCYITWPKEIAAFYSENGNMKRELEENGGIEIYLREAINISCFEVLGDLDYVMKWSAIHKAFRSRRMVIFRDPRLRDCPLVAVNSIEEPERYFIFRPSDTKAGQEGHREKVWGEIGQLLDTIGNR